MAPWQYRCLDFPGKKNEIYKSGSFGQVGAVSEEVITGSKILKYPVLAFPSWQTVSFSWPANATPWKPPSSVSKHPQ